MHQLLRQVLPDLSLPSGEDPDVSRIGSDLSLWLNLGVKQGTYDKKVTFMPNVTNDCILFAFMLFDKIV